MSMNICLYIHIHFHMYMYIFVYLQTLKYVCSTLCGIDLFVCFCRASVAALNHYLKMRHSNMSMDWVAHT